MRHYQVFDRFVLPQGIIVLEPQKLCIEIVIEIDFWQLSDFDSDFDFDFDGCRPSMGSPHEHPAIYNIEIIGIPQRTKLPWPCTCPSCHNDWEVLGALYPSNRNHEAKQAHFLSQDSKQARLATIIILSRAIPMG
jgi:hypothetical protein